MKLCLHKEDHICLLKSWIKNPYVKLQLKLSLKMRKISAIYYRLNSFWENVRYISIILTLAIAELILQPFRHFTYVTSHSPTLPSLYLRHSSFSNRFVDSPTSQLILQPFFRFSYVRGSWLTSAGEPSMPFLRFWNEKHWTDFSATFDNQ